MTITYKILLSILLSAFLPAAMDAQITVQSASETKTLANLLVTADSIYLVKDLIIEGAGNVVLESVTNASAYYYEWTRYNAATNEWSIPAANGDIASYPVPVAGGYQLSIKEGMNGSILEQHRCWVFNSPLAGASIQVLNENCDDLHLNAQADSLAYYDTDGSYALVDYIDTYNWTSSTGEGVFSESEQAPHINAPVEDTDFTVVVTDLFDNSVSASLSYTAIAVEALYSSESVKPDVLNEGHTEAEGSAPIEIRFTDESKGHITAWEWNFGSSTAVERDPFHIFTSLGIDTVYLRVVNTLTEYNCESISQNPLIVTITDMHIEAPNTFTPNGDGANDEFRVYYKSVKNFSMVVFSRWGRKVYESTNPADGWDGTIGNGLADPGVYFYVIEAEGYNPNEKKKLQGPIHLIRGKN